MRSKLLFSGLILLLAFGFAIAKIGGGDITFNSPAGKVVFSHENHIKGAGLKCTDCHDKLFLNTKKHKSVTMAQMAKGKSCGACHNGKVAFSVKDKDSCNTCHQK
jgi:c(7)-type cytochrome triheme protein